MDIESIITQVNDCNSIVAIDINAIEIKPSDPNNVSMFSNIVIMSHNEASFQEESIGGVEDGADVGEPAKPPPTPKTAAASAVAAAPSPASPTDGAAIGAGIGAAKPPRGRIFRDLFCCLCPDRDGRATEQRRLRRQQRQEQQQQQRRLNGQALTFELLGPRDPALEGKICAVIDLDETLVHSSFKYVEEPDFTIDVEIEGMIHPVYVLKRPHVDEFLERMGQLYECVLFTASLAKYADPVSDKLDKWGAFKYRLFREACVLQGVNFVKDLALLGRYVDRCIIIDNSPASYMFHTENAIHVRTWVGDPADTELLDLLPFLERLAAAPSVTQFLRDFPPPRALTPAPERSRPLTSPSGDEAAEAELDAVRLCDLQSPVATES